MRGWPTGKGRPPARKARQVSACRPRRRTACRSRHHGMGVPVARVAMCSRDAPAGVDPGG
eukprot:6499221-Alexandrium_andersonii.AAC.1